MVAELVIFVLLTKPINLCSSVPRIYIYTHKQHYIHTGVEQCVRKTLFVLRDYLRNSGCTP